MLVEVLEIAVGIYAKPAKTAKPVPNLVHMCRFGIYTSINAKPEMIHNSTKPGSKSIDLYNKYLYLI